MEGTDVMIHNLKPVHTISQVTRAYKPVTPIDMKTRHVLCIIQALLKYA